MNDKHDTQRYQEAPEENDMIDRLVQRQAQKGKHGNEKENMASALKLSYIFIGILFFINLFMAFALLNVYKDRSVSLRIPPATLQDNELVFGSTRVSKTVYETFADYLIRLVGNVNHHDVEKKYQDFLGYVDAGEYHRIAKVLVGQAEAVKHDMVTRRFQLQEIKLTKLKNGYVKAEGLGFADKDIGDTKAFEKLPYHFTLYLTAYMGNVIVVGLKSGVYMDEKDIASRRKVEKYEKNNPYINF